MAVWNGPPRGGSRGGRDKFNWEDVKASGDRTYYLGHSEKALTGRWQQGKDVYWYTRDQGGPSATAAAASAEQERAAVKAHEEQLTAEALGIKPKSAASEPQRQLSEQERRQLLQRHGSGGQDAEAGMAAGLAAEGDEAEAEHGRGLGFQRAGGAGVAGAARLEGFDDLGAAQRLPQRHRDAAQPASAGRKREAASPDGQNGGKRVGKAHRGHDAGSNSPERHKKKHKSKHKEKDGKSEKHTMHKSEKHHKDKKVHKEHKHRSKKDKRPDR